MIVFNNNMFAVITPDVFAVDFCPCIFTLTQSADIEIVFKNTLNGGDCPDRLDLPLVFLALGFLAHLLGHSRSGNAAVGQIICDFLVSPALVVVEVEDFSDYIRLGRNDFKLFAGVDDVAVGCGAEPFTVRLTALYDITDFL